MRECIAYPTFIKKSGEDYLVFVPDLQLYTEGESFANAIMMARDAIGLKLLAISDENAEAPAPSSDRDAILLAQKDADEDFDFSDGSLTYVDIDLTAYRNRIRNKSVKKNCTLPQWLCEAAEQEGINFSKILQEALMEKLHLAP